MTGTEDWIEVRVPLGDVTFVREIGVEVILGDVQVKIKLEAATSVATWLRENVGHDEWDLVQVTAKGQSFREAVEADAQEMAAFRFKHFTHAVHFAMVFDLLVE